MKKSVPKMIERVIAAALTSLQALVNALALRVTTCKTRQKRSTDFSSLQVDVANLQKNIDYLKSIDFNDMMRIAVDKDAHEDAETADTNVDTDKEVETSGRSLQQH